MNGKNSAKIYIIENKIVSLFSAAKVMGEKRGRKMRLIFLKLLKTNVEKMSIFPSLHDIHENKRVKPFSPRY
jgi:hypothetical protein